MHASTNLGDASRISNQALARPVEDLDSVVIRFVGDSGDGMQLTGTGFGREILIGIFALEQRLQEQNQSRKTGNGQHGRLHTSPALVHVTH
jgi:hypothetical protein